MNIPIHDHADDGDLLRYVDGELDELEVEEIERHIGECVLCRDRYDDLAAASDSLTAFLNKADYPLRTLARETRPPRGGWWTSPLAKAAAVVLLLVGVGAPVGAFLAVNDADPVPVRQPAAIPPTGARDVHGGTSDAVAVDRQRLIDELLQSGDIDRALRNAADIQSDAEAADVLSRIVNNRNLTDVQADVVLQIAGNIASDAELGWLLRYMLENAKLTPHMLQGMLERSLDISSDSEMTEFLLAFTALVPLTAELRGPYLAAVESVASDFEAARLLEAFFNSGAAGGGLTPEQFETVAGIAAGISSDTELGGVLRRLLDRPDLTTEQTDILLQLALGIASDSEMASFLIDFNMRSGLNGGLRRAAYAEAMNTIASDHEMGRVLDAYIQNSLSTDDLAEALRASMSIASDVELANFLVKVAETFELRGAALDQYREAAATISSDSQSARVAAALAGSRR